MVGKRVSEICVTSEWYTKGWVLLPALPALIKTLSFTEHTDFSTRMIRYRITACDGRYAILRITKEMYTLAIWEQRVRRYYYHD